MMNCCCCESQQEAWIREAAEGKPNRFRKDNPRVIDMLESFDCTPPYVDIERARYFTESMKQTEGQHLTLRWAKALMNVAQKMPVYIEDTQLIVGRLGTDKGRYGIVYPELDGDYQASALKELPGHEASPFDVNAEDARAVEEIITPYWKDKTFHQDLNSRLDPGLCRQGRLHLPLHLLRNGLQPFQPAVVPGLGTSVQAGLQGHP